MKYKAKLLSVILCWTLTGTATRTIDGDTFDMTAQIWHGLTVTERVRILDIDTPEKLKANWVAYLEARAFTESWLKKGSFEIYTCERDAFGRSLAKVFRGDDVLADRLREAGHIKKRTHP